MADFPGFPNCPNITKIVYLMLENRSFDHIFGLLYDSESKPANIINPGNFFPPSDDGSLFNGGRDLTTYSGYTNSDKKGNTYHVKTVDSFTNPPVDSCYIPDHDCDHDYSAVWQQVFGTSFPGSGNLPASDADMSGFVDNYIGYSGYTEPLQINQAMSAFAKQSNPDEQMLSVLRGLGHSYAVSDQWFASLPSETFCNRAFSLCGNSQLQTGVYAVNNDDHHYFTSPTIWDVLYGSKGKGITDWKIFYSEDYPTQYSPPGSSRSWCFTRDYFFQGKDISNLSDYFLSLEDFCTAAEEGALPTFSYIEPAWYNGCSGVNGPTSYHAPSNLGYGEQFLQRIYEAVTQPATWPNVLFIITFDEHGGIYDHVPPPKAVPPVDGAGSYGEDDFDFQRFGVRVPAIFVSPYITPQTVLRPPTNSKCPFDHTSVLATILKYFGITQPTNPSLGSRVAAAPTFEHVLNSFPGAPISTNSWTSHCLEEAQDQAVPVTGLDRDLLTSRLAHIRGRSLDDPQNQKDAQQILASVNNVKELLGAIVQYSKDHRK